MDEGGSRSGACLSLSLSEEAQCGGPLERASLQETLEDTVTYSSSSWQRDNLQSS
jgi:hypothetical protein